MLPGPGELHEETSWGLLQITAVRLSDIDERELLARCCAFSVAECRYAVQNRWYIRRDIDPAYSALTRQTDRPARLLADSVVSMIIAADHRLGGYL
jgi:hypothetical protein